MCCRQSTLGRRDNPLLWFQLICLCLFLAGCEKTDNGGEAPEPKLGITRALLPQVTLADTVLIGTRDAQGTAGFLGIPFAKPPVGEARWQRPVPYALDGGRLDATQFAPACMQSGSGLNWYHGMMRRVGVDPALMEGPEYSEDCLYLNVWTDVDDATLHSQRSDDLQLRPVLMFIHGGSNTGGWSYEPNYHGGPLARKGAVVVTVAYRLGVFGWMNHPEMTTRNLALHDLSLALDWVHTHIAKFGGDPERITVSGESAGAANALHLALSPLSGTKIHGVIHQSGGWPAVGGPTPKETRSRAQQLQQVLLGPEGSLEGLRDLPAQKLMDVTGDIYSGMRFGAIEDTESLPRTLQQRVADGDLPPLNIIIGTNANESLMYIKPEATVASYLQDRIPAHRWSAVVAAAGDGLDERTTFDRLGTAVTFLCPSLMLADAMGSAGGRVFVYRFDRVRPNFDSIGAYHGAELPYVFDRHDAWLPTEAVDNGLTEMMVGYWHRFISQGDPNGPDLMVWPQWQPTDQKAVIFSEDSSVMLHPDSEFCAVLSDT
jgi:para-nitrobenzyl esterase